MHFNIQKLAPFLFLLMWSSGAVMVKLGLQYASIWSFLSARAFVSLICLLLLYKGISLYRPSLFTRPSMSELKRILMVGLLLQVAYLSFYFMAIHTGISPGLVTLILGMQPLITPFFSTQKINVKQSLLLMVGFVGLVVSILGSKELIQFPTSGFIFAGIALMSITYGTVLQTTVSSHILQNMVYQNILSTPIFIAISLSVGWSISWTPEFLISLIWMSLVVSVGALLLLMYMTKHESATSVSVLFYAIPLLAYLFDYLLFDGGISLLTVTGMVIVALSIILYRRSTLTSKQPQKSHLLVR